VELTKQQRDSLIISIETELYSKSFYEFVLAGMKIMEPSINFIPNWHIKYLCDIAQKEIERVAHGEIKGKDYIINVPPRTTKSIIWSIMLNSWAWINYPHLKFMTISYSEILASGFSYKTRLLIQSNWYQQHFGDRFKIMDDDNRKTSYSNNKSGTRMSFGMSGSITGSGADILILDDPQKLNDTSDLKLTSVNDIYTDTVFNRLNNPNSGSRFIVQQRADVNDLSGFLLETQPESYTHICFPMELNDKVQPEHFKEYYQDGLLWNDRFGNEVIQQYRKNLGTRGYDTQYQQNPINNEGYIIKGEWFSIVESSTIPNYSTIQWDLFVDTAYTNDIKNDETAIIIAGKLNNSVYIKKTYAVYMEFPELINKITELSSLIGKSGRIYIEPKASGKSIVQQLKRSTNLNVIETKTPTDSKQVRVTSITPKLEAKRVILIKDSSNSLFMNQMTSFPYSKNDGVVDVMYYSVDKYLGGGGLNFAM